MEASMKYFVLVAAIAALAIPASAQVTCCYSWEDGGTILSSYGNVTDVSNVSGMQTGSQGSTLPDYTCPGAQDGTYYLHVAEDPHSSTPEVYVAWVVGLTDGDVVSASFYGFDLTPDASPSLRIWGGYTPVGGTIDDYAGSAGGNSAYTAGTGWDFLDWSWTFDSDGGTRDGLVIKVRLYSYPATSDPDHTDYWIDNLCVTAPTTACTHFPTGGTPVEDTTWGNIKALYQ
jgi:hypothetical protein